MNVIECFDANSSSESTDSGASNCTNPGGDQAADQAAAGPSNAAAPAQMPNFLPVFPPFLGHVPPGFPHFYPPYCYGFPPRPPEPNSNNQQNDQRTVQAINPKSLIVSIKSLDLHLTPSFFEKADKKGTTFNVRFAKGNVVGKLAVKWLRYRHNCGFGRHFPAMQQAADETSKVVSAFLSSLDTRGWSIRVIKPLVLQGCGGIDVAVEPHVGKVRRFTRNSFWETENCHTYAKVIVALGHFSATFCMKRSMLTNLQAAINEKDKIVTLLAPTIMSCRSGAYGCEDLGRVKKFFEHHRCNSICTGLPK